MLVGPDLLVILGIALIVFGPQKLPELAKKFGKAMGEFKRTAEEVKESIGIKDLEGIGGGLNRVDLLTTLAERVSASMSEKEQVDPGKGATPSVEASTSVADGVQSGKREGKGKIPPEGLA